MGNFSKILLFKVLILKAVSAIIVDNFNCTTTYIKFQWLMCKTILVLMKTTEFFVSFFFPSFFN